MTDNMSLRCIAWRGIAPGLETLDQWRTFATSGTRTVPEQPFKPALEKVPANLRRRLTPLTRLVLASWLEACEAANMSGAELPIVFASHHGEIGILESLLGLMHTGEPLSPTDFCHSVHHTPTGYLSMIAGHRGIARTVSAGAFTFGAGILEVTSLLATGEYSCVALTVADETVPEVFHDTSGFPPFSFALTFLFSGAGSPSETDGRSETSTFAIHRLTRYTSVFEFVKEL